MSDQHEGIEIRSYRRVFALERRVYRIDSIPLNPNGVPLRGIAYFAVLLAMALVVSRLTLVGAAVRLLPWYMRELAGPALGAFVFTAVRIEGRPFHLAALALLRHGTGRWRRSLRRWVVRRRRSLKRRRAVR